jgi:hypothetical protein
MMIPPVAWSVRAQGRARRRLLLRSRPGSGEDAIPPEVEVEAGPWGRARRSPPSEAEAGAEPWGRARRRPSSEAEAGAKPLGRARRSPPSEAEAGAEPWGRARRRPSSEAEAGAKPLGRARRRPPVAPEAGLSCCQPHPGGWHSSRSGAGDAVFLSGQSVEGRSDCGHFDPAD